MNREREQVYKDKLLEIVNYPKDNIIFVKNFLNNFWKFLKSPINFASRYKCNQVLKYVDKVDVVLSRQSWKSFVKLK